METRKMPGEDYQLMGQALIFYMPKELDHHVAQFLCKELDFLIDTYGVKELMLDFKNTEFMDSSGIGVVIGRTKTMQFRGGKVYALHMGKRVRMIFDSVGLEKIIEIKEEI